jgi:hypothetical protein
LSQLAEQEAHVIGVEAYVYFYPLLIMEITRIYPVNLVNPDGKPLDGTDRYFASFRRVRNDTVADAFWSITPNDEEGFTGGELAQRFAISSWISEPDLEKHRDPPGWTD